MGINETVNITENSISAAGGYAGALAALAGIGATGVMIFALVWYVLQVIAYWKIFRKMGESGWKSIIPIYNDYIMYKRTWNTKYFWIMILLSIAAGIFENIAIRNQDAVIWVVIACVLMVAALIIEIIQYHKLSKAFGHGAGFTLGLIFLAPVFRLILGFGKSEYIGNGSNQR